MPYMSDADIREVIKLKKRYERLIDWTNFKMVCLDKISVKKQVRVS
jgi:hypothetical protein